MKLAIYEAVHLECVIPLAELLKESPYSVTFFVHKKMQEDIENSLSRDNYAMYNWVYMEDQSISSLYKSFNHHINLQQYDLLWLNTNDSRHIVFALLKLAHKKMKLLINVHEINNFFRPHVSLNIRHLVRSVSKKILSRYADAYILNADKMKENIEIHKLTLKPCYVVTPVYYKAEDNKLPPGNKFTVVIPGSVDERRRNYRSALRAWKMFIEEKDPAINATLILAGPLTRHGEVIAATCANDAGLQDTVRLFDDEIPEQIFQRILADAAVLLSPQNIKTSTSDNIEEEYGVTKTSGNTCDAIRHAKPYIIPRRLAIPGDIETSAIRYSEDSELAGIFKTLSTDKSALGRFREKATENSQKFSYESMRQKILTMLTAVLAPQ